MVPIILQEDRALVLRIARDLAQAAQQADDRANMHALNKAALHLDQGLHISEDPAGDLLIPSGTRGGIVHRVNGSCSCEAGTKGQACWHMAVKEILTTATEHRDQAEADRRATIATMDARTKAYAEMDELFA